MKPRSLLTMLGKVLVLALVLFFAIFSVPDIGATVQEPYTRGAHRGSSVQFVENTLDAFIRAANEDQYHFIEFDLQYTKDKKIIVFHDETLLRFQKQLFKVSDLTYEELSALSRYPIPLYEEVIAAVGGKKKLNIEIKSRGNLDEDKKMIDGVVEDLRSRNILSDVLFSSISEEVVKYIKESYPQIKVGQIFFITPVTYFGSQTLTERFYASVSPGAD